MTPTVFHQITFEDADAGMDFMRRLGFEARAVYRNESEAEVVDHAEFAWDGSAAVMCNSATTLQRQQRVGASACYLVVDTNEQVDAVYRRGMDAGGSSCLAPHNPEYGGRTACVRDPEGNHYSVGTYPGQKEQFQRADQP